MNVARSALNNFFKICGNVDINLYEEITRRLSISPSTATVCKNKGRKCCVRITEVLTPYYFVSSQLSVVFAVFTYVKLSTLLKLRILKLAQIK